MRGGFDWPETFIKNELYSDILAPVRKGGLWGARVAATALTLGVVFGVPARADGQTVPPDPPIGPSSVIVGSSSCPEPGAVWAAMGTLLPPDRLAERLRVAGNLIPVEILDLGASFRLIAAGRVREYRDEARDCADRARVAAVFVALAIDPAGILTTPKPPAPPPPPPEPAGPSAPIVTAPRPAARIAIGATGVAGLGPDARIVQPGIAVRVAVGRGRIAVAGGAAALLPMEATVGGVRLDHLRVPADVGLRIQGTGSRLQAYAEMGLLVAVVSERAVDLAMARAQTSIRGRRACRAGAAARNDLSFCAVRRAVRRGDPGSG